MRIALISFWHLHGKDYALAAEEHPDVDIVAIWDEDPVRGAAEAAAREIPFVHSLQEVLDDSTIDGVVVCSPTSDHHEIVVACARAGKHVFMEKVLANTLIEAESIVAAAQDAGIVLTVSLWRSDKGYAHQIADLVAEGTVGEVTSARIRDGHPFALSTAEHPDGFLPDNFYDPSTAQGGALIDLCHPLYLLALICGLPQTATSTFGHVTERAVEDNAAVLVGYPNGALGVVETTYTSRITPFSIEVHGTLGSVLYSEPGIGAFVHARMRDAAGLPEATTDDVARLRVFSGEGGQGSWRDVPIAPDEPQAFTRWVRLSQSGERDVGNLRLALQLSALVDAAYASAASGRRIDIPRPTALPG